MSRTIFCPKFEECVSPDDCSLSLCCAYFRALLENARREKESDKRPTEISKMRGRMSNEIDMVSLARQLLPTRGDYQLALEDNIVTFNGDALEVHDMLDAFKKSLKDRYGEDQLADVLEAFQDLQEALCELDRTTVS